MYNREALQEKWKSFKMRMKNKEVPNRIVALLHPEGRISVEARWGFGCEVNAGGAVDQIYNPNDPEQISGAARYLRCEELDILEAIATPGQVVNTTMFIKTIQFEGEL